jgi:hypothetical protein
MFFSSLFSQFASVFQMVKNRKTTQMHVLFNNKCKIVIFATTKRLKKIKKNTISCIIYRIYCCQKM